MIIGRWLCEIIFVRRRPTNLAPLRAGLNENGMYASSESDRERNWSATEMLNCWTSKGRRQIGSIVERCVWMNIVEAHRYPISLKHIVETNYVAHRRVSSHLLITTVRHTFTWRISMRLWRWLLDCPHQVKRTLRHVTDHGGYCLGWAARWLTTSAAKVAAQSLCHSSTNLALTSRTKFSPAFWPYRYDPAQCAFHRL